MVNFFGIAFNYTGEADLMDDASGLYPAIAAAFTGLNAYSFMIFNLLCAPCFAAMGAIKREMNNWKWTLGAIGYMCGFAYVISMIVYQIGGLITGEVGFGLGTVAAAAVIVLTVYLLFRKNKYESDRLTLSSVEAARRAAVR